MTCLLQLLQVFWEDIQSCIQSFHFEIYGQKLFILRMLGNFSCFFEVCFKINIYKKIFQEYHQSVSFDPDQDQHSVSPDLGPNSLQRLSADDKSRLGRK